MPRSVVAADFDGDGFADFATGNERGSINVFRGDGAGSFFASARIVTGRTNLDIVAADVTSDGLLDLVTVNGGAESVTVVVGRGVEGFRENFTTLLGGGDPGALVAEDFDRDGHVELALSLRQSGEVQLLFGNGTGRFTVTRAIDLEGRESVAITSADFNRDGFVDLAALDRRDALVSFLFGDGAGNFDIDRTLSVGPTASFLLGADFDGSGFSDLAIANSSASTISIILDRTTPGTSLDTNENGFPDECEGRQVSGDCNQDGSRDISDAICLLHFLFQAPPHVLPCGDGAALNPSNVSLMDQQGDRVIDISDAIMFLTSLFSSTPSPSRDGGCFLIPECPNTTTCDEG